MHLGGGGIFKTQDIKDKDNTRTYPQGHLANSQITLLSITDHCVDLPNTCELLSHRMPHLILAEDNLDSI